MKNKLISEITWNFIQASSSYIIPFFSFALILRTVDKAVYGELIQSYIVGTFALSILDFGTSIYATRKIARAKKDTQISRLISNIIFLKILLIFLITLVILILSFFFHISQAVFAYLISMFIACLFPDYLFRGLQKTFVNAFAQWIQGLVYFLSLILIIGPGSTAYDIIKCQIIGNVVLLIYGYLVATLRYQTKIQIPKVRIILALINDCKRIFASRIMVSIISPFNLLIVTKTSNSISTVAEFGVAYNMMNTIKSLYTPIADGCLPEFNRTRSLRLYLKPFFLMNLVNLVALVCLYQYSDKLISLIAGVNYIEADYFFKLMMVSALISLPSYILGYPVLSSFNLTSAANKSVTIGVIVYFTSIFILYLVDGLRVDTIILSGILSEISILLFRVYKCYENFTHIFFKE